MPLWIVEGADENNGSELVVTIEADTRTEAERISRKKGILVSSIEPGNDGKADVTESSTATVSVDYASPSSTPADVPPFEADIPEYRGLMMAEWIFRIITWLTVAGTVIKAMTTLADHELSNDARILVSALVLFGGLCVSALWYAASHAVQALRDIARNSFRK